MNLENHFEADVVQFGIFSAGLEHYTVFKSWFFEAVKS
jgi:hypothetical protein